MINWMAAPEAAMKLLEMEREGDRPLPLWGFDHPRNRPWAIRRRRPPAVAPLAQPAPKAVAPA